MDYIHHMSFTTHLVTSKEATAFFTHGYHLKLMVFIAQ